MGVLDMVEDILNGVLAICRSNDSVETSSLTGGDLSGKEVLANFLIAVFPGSIFINPERYERLVQATDEFAVEFESMVEFLASDGISAMHSSTGLMNRFMAAYEKTWTEFRTWKQSMTCVALNFHLGKLKDLVDAVDTEIKGTPLYNHTLMAMTMSLERLEHLIIKTPVEYLSPELCASLIPYTESAIRKLDVKIYNTSANDLILDEMAMKSNALRSRLEEYRRASA